MAAMWLGLALSAVTAAAANQRTAQAAALADRRLAAVVGRNATPQLLGAARIGSQFGVVTSGIRSVAHNRRVGGVPNSYHLTGLGLDIQRRPGVSHAVIAAALRRAGYVLIESLDEGDHSHFAVAGQYAVPRQGVTSPPAAKPAPAPSPLLADDHGVLLIDSAPPAEGASD